MRRAYWLVPLLAIGAMAINVIVSIGVVWVYSSFVAPGHDLAFYEAFAQSAAPISSVVAGIPILFAAAWLAARWCAPAGPAAGIAVGVVYVAIDAAVLVAAGAGSGLWMVAAIGYVTKLAAAALGGYLGARRGA